MNRKILLLTSRYPYYPGEQFLEDEAAIWSLASPDCLIILPQIVTGDPRRIPDHLKVNSALAEKRGFGNNFFWRIRTLFSSIFLKECVFILRKRRFRLSIFLTAFRASNAVLRSYRRLSQIIKTQYDDPVLYVYWFDTMAYASALLKRKGLVRTIVSRAHGFDVYEEIRPANYMPLKRQFISDFDEILAISEKGKDYLARTYDISRDRIQVARLGVLVSKTMTAPSPNGQLVLISVSNCISNKRIDKIISSLALLALQRPDLDICWHHIGEGPELKELSGMASKKLNKPNLTWHFHGAVTNKEVRAFLANSCIDVFVNTSNSEGVPVSIMEAMSLGIPAIAPDVGGVSELISNDNGRLLNAYPDIKEICQNLGMVDHFKSHKTRQAAKSHITTYFDANRNYRNVVAFFDQLRTVKVQ